MGKLTDRMKEYLRRLDQSKHPIDASGPAKAMCNKLLKQGLARYHSGYPSGYVITPAGRAALEDNSND